MSISEREFAAAMEADVMASTKLAEGIAAFCEDACKLERVLELEAG